MNILDLVRKQLSGSRRVLMFGPATPTLPIGARLLVGNAAFRKTFIEASDFVEARRGWSMWRELDNDAPPPGITMSERNFVQEVALQLALFEAFRETGTEYEAIAGISLGDGPAAYAAGALTFDEAMHVTCETIAAVLAASGGDLIAVQAMPKRVRKIVGDAEVTLIFDWSMSSVWAVPDECARPMQLKLRAAGVPYMRLRFNCLSHTDRVDVPALVKAFGGLTDRKLTHRLYSTLEGGIVGDFATPDRYARVISERVKLDSMWRAMRRDGYTDIIYIGSVPAGKDLFGALPSSKRPSSFKGAESFISIGEAAAAADIGSYAESSPTIASAINSAAFARDPFPYYRQWLAEGNVHELPGEPIYAVLGYDAAVTVLKQPELFSSSPSAHISPTLLGADPPDHTRMRRLLSPFFSRERQLAQRDSIERMTAHVTKEVRRKGPFDAVSDFASRLLFAISCDWLGLDEQRAVALALLPPEEVTWLDVERALKADGTLPQIVASGELTEREITLVVPFLVAAGITTTRDLLLLSMHTLTSQRDLLEQVAADPALVPSLIEEMLRYNSTGHGVVRRVRENTLLEGVEIPAESTVWVFLSAANRDPMKFERPDEFILGREGPRHLGFGTGPHFCFGSHLGRLETELIVKALLPDLSRLKTITPPDFMLNDIREDAPWMRGMRSWQISLAR